MKARLASLLKRSKRRDAFGRTGGYSASLSTFGFGFLEAFWNPNRQTVHDRISGTVVLWWPRRGRKGEGAEVA